MSAPLFLFFISFKTSRIGYYVWARDVQDATNLAVLQSEGTRVTPEDVEKVREIEQKRGVMSAVSKGDVFR